MAMCVLRRLSAAFVGASALFAQTCPPQGLTLSSDAGRLGDAWTLVVTGQSGAPGVLAFDVASGPTQTPIGTICLGLTPAFQLFEINLGPSGWFLLNGVSPATPSLMGATIYAQAAAVDPSQPSGFALSGGLSTTLRSPKMFFVAPGVTSPFGVTPGAIAAVNVLTETVPVNAPLSSSVREVVHVPVRRWLAILRGDGTIGFHSEDALISTGSTTPPAGAVNPSKIAATADGEHLILLAGGTPASPFGGGVPGSVHVYSFATSTWIASATFASGNPDALLVDATSGLAYARFATQVVPFVPATGFLFPPIVAPAIYGALVDWRLANGFLYCLHGGSTPNPFGGGGAPGAVTMMDAYGFTTVSTATLVGAAPFQMLRVGPGTTGPSVYAYGQNAGTLQEFAQFTLAPTGSVAISNALAALELSSLGTQWLLLCNGAACGGPAILSMPIGTLAPTVAAPLLPGFQPLIAVSPSDSLGKAYLVSGSSTAVPLYTDPVVPPFATISLPVSSSSFRVVADR